MHQKFTTFLSCGCDPRKHDTVGWLDSQELAGPAVWGEDWQKPLLSKNAACIIRRKHWIWPHVFKPLCVFHNWLEIWAQVSLVLIQHSIQVVCRLIKIHKYLLVDSLKCYSSERATPCISDYLHVSTISNTKQFGRMRLCNIIISIVSLFFLKKVSVSTKTLQPYPSLSEQHYACLKLGDFPRHLFPTSSSIVRTLDNQRGTK